MCTTGVCLLPLLLDFKSFEWPNFKPNLAFVCFMAGCISILGNASVVISTMIGKIGPTVAIINAAAIVQVIEEVLI